MNRFLTIFALIGMIAFQACEGPIGPEGPQGEPGINILGTTFEIELDFNAANEYSNIRTLPFQLEESDAILVYRLSGADNNNDVWRLLPQTYFFDQGMLMYNFDYTKDDVSVFLDGTIAASALGTGWTDNQIFRVIVVPADFYQSRIDWTDYEGVTKLLGISDSDFVKIDKAN